MSRSGRFATAAVLLATSGTVAGYLGYRALLRGALTIDLGVGRRVRPLGSQSIDIDAPREVVFDVLTAPYLRSAPGGVRLLEVGTNWVLAAHRIPLPDGRVAHTLDTARFTPPERVDYRLVRGPVPYAVETYALAARDGGTHLSFQGEIGTDLWGLGELWGRLVVSRWDAVVTGFLREVKTDAERASAVKRAS